METAPAQTVRRKKAGKSADPWGHVVCGCTMRVTVCGKPVSRWSVLVSVFRRRGQDCPLCLALLVSNGRCARCGNPAPHLPTS